MKYVLAVGPKLIPTDGMIMEGSRYLLNKAGVVVNEYIQINDHELEFQKPVQAPTHIIVLGTPWLWHKCHESIKYINLHNIFGHYPDAKKLFLGIGSCLPIGPSYEEVKDDMMTRYEHLSLFNDATVVVRDALAATLLWPVPTHNLPCPAHWAAINEPTSTKGGPVMFWYDPTRGISSSSFKDPEPWYKYSKQFKEWHKQYKPTVYCIDKNEISTAELIGLPKPIVIQDVNHAKIIIANAERIISGRVHLAVPAKALKKPVELIAVDTRANTLYDHLNKPNERLDAYEAEYLRILQEFIS